MNRIGIYYGYFLKDWNGDILQCIDRATKIGFDILEISIDNFIHLPLSLQQKVKESARERGIQLTFCAGLSAEHDLASPEETVRRNGIEYLKRCLFLIQKMDSHSFSGVNYAAWGSSLPKGVNDKRPYVKRCVASMKEVMKASENCGIRYNIEVVNRYEQFLFNTCDEGLDFIRQVESPNLKLLLDTYHMNIEEDDMKQPIVEAGSLLGHFHIGECNRRQPGRGHLQWDAVFSGLKEIHYQGSIVMEPFVIPNGEIASDVYLYRDLSKGEDLDQKAAEALSFVKGKLAH